MNLVDKVGLLLKDEKEFLIKYLNTKPGNNIHHGNLAFVDQETVCRVLEYRMAAIDYVSALTPKMIKTEKGTIRDIAAKLKLQLRDDPIGDEINNAMEKKIGMLWQQILSIPK